MKNEWRSGDNLDFRSCCEVVKLQGGAWHDAMARTPSSSCAPFKLPVSTKFLLKRHQTINFPSPGMITRLPNLSSTAQQPMWQAEGGPHALCERYPHASIHQGDFGRHSLPRSRVSNPKFPPTSRVCQCHARPAHMVSPEGSAENKYPDAYAMYCTYISTT